MVAEVFQPIIDEIPETAELLLKKRIEILEGAFESAPVS
jgi:hypothetical protein